MNKIAHHKRIAIPRSDGGFDVPLGGDVFAIIDECDVPAVTQKTWTKRADKHGIYAWTSKRVNGRQTSISLGRFLLNPPSDMQIDHIDRNPLNNRRNNLRIVTPQQNSWNRIRPNKYGFIGVTMVRNRFLCRVRYLGTQISSYHDTAEEAAKARDAIVLRIGGEFVRLNFPEAV